MSAPRDRVPSGVTGGGRPARRRLRAVRVAGRASRALLVSATAGAALTGTVLAGIVLAGPADAAYHGSEGRIAFVRGGDIYSIQPNGAGLRNLAKGGGSSGPRWSPNGKRIAYIHSGNLWIMNADGTHKTQITHAAPKFTDARPTWSPNGRYLAFVKTRKGRPYGYLTRYDTVARNFRAFTTTINGSLVKVTAIPSAVAWQEALNAASVPASFIMFEGAGPLCGPPLTFCLDLVGFAKQSRYRNGFPSLEQGQTGTTRLLDPDWLPSSPPFATGFLATSATCSVGQCTPDGILYLHGPLVLPGGYQAVFSPSAAHIAYVASLRGKPEIYVTTGGQAAPPPPGTRLTRGTEPDWQPTAPF